MSTNYTNVADEIITIPGFLPGARCESLSLKLKARSGWKPATVKSKDGFVVRPEHRASWILEHKEIGVAGSRLMRELAKRAYPVAHDVFGQAENRMSPLHFQKYSKGGFFKAHRDIAGIGDERSLTAILFLNENFTGGETEFPADGVGVRPRAGMLLMFRSRILHRSTEVIEGQKVTAVSWFLERNMPWI